MKFKAATSWFLHLAGIRILVLLLALLAIVICRDIALSFLSTALTLDEPPSVWLGRKGPLPVSVSAVSYSVVACIMLLVLGYGVYRAAVAALERRAAVELGSKGATKEFAIGTAIGLGFVLLTAGVIWCAGGLQVLRAGSIFAAISGASLALTAGFMEELAVRGVIFRIVEERWGTWLALFLTAGVFGLLHLGNENSSWLCALSIALSAGGILGLAFVVTRRLWLAVGLHFGVNLSQAMLGLPVSGRQSTGLVVSELAGSPILTGGEFGIEASAVTVILAVSLAVGFVIVAKNRDQIRPPFWNHAQRDEQTCASDS